MRALRQMLTHTLTRILQKSLVLDKDTENEIGHDLLCHRRYVVFLYNSQKYLVCMLRAKDDWFLWLTMQISEI
jgi:hypothetical protein